MTYKKLQNQYDKIYSYFKTTTELFDYLKWDGRVLLIWKDNKVIERYLLEDLKKIKCI
jgi:hypothetical protein